MADTKITGLTTGALALPGDELPANRAGADRKLSITDTRGVVYQQGLPLVIAATGTTDAVGAFTLGTALTGAFPAACYMWFPANTVNDSHAAGFYYCTMSSTTVGVMFQDTYSPSSTPPTIPASPTACTTANNWTGVTGAVTAISFSLPANALGANGSLEFPVFLTGQTNNANAKTIALNFGALAWTGNMSLASVGTQEIRAICRNSASTSAQVGNSTLGTSSQVPTKGTVDTTAAVTVTVVLNKGTATDNMSIFGLVARVVA